MEKIIELLYKKEQYLNEGETLILVKIDEIQVLSNEGEELSLLSSPPDKKLKDFLDSLKEEGGNKK